ncbi:hypothetical protein FJY93_02150 [Candidatus Kaiserbacteria bacterium]|nr:hypothetical protein [Candidatus Kaiserbacteria bacterium]
MKENNNKDEKRERFKRLATYRTTEVLKRLQVLANCANRSAYEYSEDEINKIFSTIDKAVRDAKSKFHYPKERINFKL